MPRTYGFHVWGLEPVLFSGLDEFLQELLVVGALPHFPFEHGVEKLLQDFLIAERSRPDAQRLQFHFRQLGAHRQILSQVVSDAGLNFGLRILDATKRLQFRAEIFNLPNHTNFGAASGGGITVFSGESAGRTSTAGRISRTSTTCRQIQFALRFSF